MIKDLIQFLDYGIFAEIAMLIFASVFLLIVARTLLIRHEDSQRLASIVFDDKPLATDSTRTNES